VRELGGDAKTAANWVMGDLAGALNRDGLDIVDSRVSALQLAGLLKRVHDQTISGKMAKEVFEAMWAGEGEADSIISKRGLEQITDSSAIEQLVEQVVVANAKQAEQYRAGKAALFGFFVGQVMKACGGKANPQQVNTLLKAKLGEPRS
jgi:aspartyl-tRNA(Asn)/glutamyl-tRNA(Gln) amidotransferase subunit B